MKEKIEEKNNSCKLDFYCNSESRCCYFVPIMKGALNCKYIDGDIMCTSQVANLNRMILVIKNMGNNVYDILDEVLREDK